MYAPYPRSTFNPSTGRAYFHNVQFTQENSYVIDFKAITVPDPAYGFVTLSTPIKSFKVCGASGLDKFKDLISSSGNKCENVTFVLCGKVFIRDHYCTNTFYRFDN